MKSANKKGRPKQESDNTFQERFRLLIGPNASHAEIADKIGTSRQNVGNWLSGGSNTKPDIYTLAKIAKAYNVSTDYLLGLNDEKSPDMNVQAMNRHTGLSEEAIKILSSFNEHEKGVIELLSRLLCDNSFCEMISGIDSLEQKSKYIRSNCIEFIENGSPLEGKTDDLDVIRYTVHKIMEHILDCFDFRCDKDYNAIKDKMIERLDDDFINPKK